MCQLTQTPPITALFRMARHSKRFLLNPPYWKSPLFPPVNQPSPQLRRHPHDPERFLEGSRQKFCLIFLLVGLLILGLSSLGYVKDPNPFYAYFTTLAAIFFGGATCSDLMQQYRTPSRNYDSQNYSLRPQP